MAYKAKVRRIREQFHGKFRKRDADLAAKRAEKARKKLEEADALLAEVKEKKK
jgi:hypothetical protein